MFAVEPREGVEQLQIPLWFWNSAEWSAFTQASAKTQRPTLVQALRSVRDGVVGTTFTPSHEMRRYLLHRISNDRDQELVHKLVPDNLRGLLRDLPSLPSRHAILLGWASELPVLVQMVALPEQHRPKSDDPDFWAVWSGKNREGKAIERGVNWKATADDWQQMTAIKPEAATANDSSSASLAVRVRGASKACT